jgi:hypothetical protein
MGDSITWVGIDDHKHELVAAVLPGREKEPQIVRLPNEDRALQRWVRRLVREAGGGEIRICYEASRVRKNGRICRSGHSARAA